MKKLFVFVLLLVCWIYADGQARLNYSGMEIFEEFEDQGADFGITDEGVTYVDVLFEDSHVLYILDKDHVCIVTIVIPYTTKELNKRVSRYNRDYVIINSRTWHYYHEHGIIQARLVFAEYNHFVYTKI